MRRDAINDNWLVEAPDVVLPGVKVLAVELPDAELLAVGLVGVELVDVGLVDFGLVDVGLVDVGLVDVGLVDVGLVDFGLVDVGLVDVGLVDVGGAPGLMHMFVLQQQPVKPVWSIVPQLFIRSEIQVLHSLQICYIHTQAIAYGRRIARVHDESIRLSIEYCGIRDGSALSVANSNSWRHECRAVDVDTVVAGDWNALVLKIIDECRIYKLKFTAGMMFVVLTAASCT